MTFDVKNDGKEGKVGYLRHSVGRSDEELAILKPHLHRDVVLHRSLEQIANLQFKSFLIFCKIAAFT